MKEKHNSVFPFSLSQNGNYAKSQQVGLEKGALISQVNTTLIWGCNERWREGHPRDRNPGTEAGFKMTVRF